MTMIISHVKAINNLFIRPLPAGKPVRVEKAVRVSGITVFVGSKGTLYCDAIKSYAYTPSIYPWTDAMMRALEKLGVITRDQRMEHVRRCKEIDAVRDKKWRWKHLLECSEKYGFKVTAEQRSKLCPEGKENGKKDSK